MVDFSSIDETQTIVLASILSPAAVAIVNCLAQLLSKHMDHTHEQKMETSRVQQVDKSRRDEYLRTIYLDFMERVSACILYPSNENLKRYSEIYASSFLLFPQDCHALLQLVNGDIQEKDWNSATTNLERLSIKLYKSINLVL